MCNPRFAVATHCFDVGRCDDELVYRSDQDVVGPIPEQPALVERDEASRNSHPARRVDRDPLGGIDSGAYVSWSVIENPRRKSVVVS